MDRNRIEQLDENYSVNIYWSDEEEPDLSYLGEPKRKLEAGYIVREHGFLLGDYKYFEQKFENEDQAEAFYRQLQEVYLLDNIPYNGIWIDELDINDTQVEWSGYEVLATHKSGGKDDVYPPYFEPSRNHIPHKAENWSYVTEEDRQAVISKFGSLEKADYFYALEDWWEYENYGNTWIEMYLTVTLFKDGKLISYNSLGGIGIHFDNQDDDYLLSQEKELLQELLRECDINVQLAEFLEDNV